MNSLNTILSFIATKIGAFTNSISDLTGIVNGHTLSITSLQEDVSDIQAVIPSGVVEDYVEDMDVSGDWTYRKWHSGIAECWAEKTVQAPIQYPETRANGYVLGTSSTEATVSLSNFPFSFTAVPRIHVTADTGEVIAMVVSRIRATTDNAGTWSVFRNTSNSGAQNKRLMFYVVGRWK